MSDIAQVLEQVIEALGGQHRPGQEQMAQAVASALDNGDHALIQAGTGTGKSLGYLVPAVVYAAKHDARIVISTATLALQRQIYTHDLPLVLDTLEPVLGTRPRMGLFKGRSNYLCLHKMGGGYPEPDDDTLPMVAGPTSELGAQVARLHEWAKHTDTGDRDDLVPGVPGRAWSQVSVTGRECLESKCPEYERCFAQRARDQAAQAHLVVTNHAVLGVQATSHDMLGEHDVVIVDEAHELVSRITSASTRELTVAAVERAARSAARCNVDTQDLGSAARTLDAAFQDSRLGRLAHARPERLSEAVTAVQAAARGVLSALTKTADPAQAATKVATAAVTEIFDVCTDYAKDPDTMVVWLAPRDGDYDSLEPQRLVVAPLDVASVIGQKLLGERAAVLTSATLAVGGGFEVMARHVGVEDPVAIDVGSPFDYERSAILYVAAHLPRPGPGGMSPEALDELHDLIQAAGGRTLGLFSSHRAALEATEAMRDRLDVPVIYQRDDQVSTVIDQFRSDPHACLFGAATLWQGIDVPGETCSLVVIDRIPFPRPDEPISQARSEAVTAAGGNGFMTVAATQAALMLAQGAGRLIRSASDRGVVAVLDSRLATARYGSFLSATLPPMWRTTRKQAVLDALTRLNGES